MQLAVSRDGINWRRIGKRKPFIPLGPPGSIDQGVVYTAKEPLVKNDELWFYYGSGDNEHGVGGNISISLAKLRIDGFISVDAEEGEGTLLTKPFCCQGEELLINTDARGGKIAVTILDEKGFWKEGFKIFDCAIFDSDSVRHKVTWRNNISLKVLQGRPIRLKFYLRKAKLYSFEIA